MADAVGVKRDDFDGLNKARPKWAYFDRETIMTANEQEWRKAMAIIADANGGTVREKPAVLLGGRVVAVYPSAESGNPPWEIQLTDQAEGGLGDESSPSKQGHEAERSRPASPSSLEPNGSPLVGSVAGAG
jgi:hypothetical protein